MGAPKVLKALKALKAPRWERVMQSVAASIATAGPPRSKDDPRQCETMELEMSNDHQRVIALEPKDETVALMACHGVRAPAPCIYSDVPSCLASSIRVVCDV